MTKLRHFKIHFYSTIYIQKWAHCQFFSRSSTLRNVVNRALTSAVTTFHPFFLSLFDKVDLNRPLDSSYLWPYILRSQSQTEKGCPDDFAVVSLLPPWWLWEVKWILGRFILKIRQSAYWLFVPVSPSWAASGWLLCTAPNAVAKLGDSER